nr:hypothetical protein [Pseudanabaena sp. 'Roaring Creek']
MTSVLDIKENRKQAHIIKDDQEAIAIAHQAESLLRRSGEYIDLANANPTDRTVAEASIAVAEAKAIAAEASILASNKLFELAGTKSTLRQYNLDRHWRCPHPYSS